MKNRLNFFRFMMLLGIILLPLGCGKSGHQGEEESPSGASFKEGRGITFKEETSKIIGLEVVDVTEEMMPEVVQVNVQIFTEIHRLTDTDMSHTGCQFHGSGFLAADKASFIQPKQSVTFQTLSGKTLEGFVVSAQKPLVHGESEVIVGITTQESGLKDGEFVKATISMPRSAPVTMIPKSALLRTVEGTYVYAVNGDAYIRTAVSAGSQTDEKIEITDGLYAGDRVVAKPVETLWLIELRATKGGGHCH